MKKSAPRLVLSGFTEEDDDDDDDDDDDEEYDNTKIVKIACERILAWKTAGRLGLCTARYESKSCC